MPVGGGAVMVVAMRVAGGRELSGDRRVDRRGLAIATELRIGQAVARLAVVGIDDVTARAARMAIVAGLVVGPHEPHIRVVEARLVKVEHGDRDAQARARPAVRLFEVGARSEEHTSELQSLMSISYAVFCLKKKNK